jgi:hypothetical protein
LTKLVAGVALAEMLVGVRIGEPAAETGTPVLTAGMNAAARTPVNYNSLSLPIPILIA